MKRLQAVRGMSDHFANELTVWRRVETALRQLVESYGYGEILTPVVESADLFIHSVGENTDIVLKEMYSFQDRNGDQLVLRPEGTASCVRAGLEHGKFYNQRQKWYYFGPMFRHERPQRGRYRQFYQFGVEAYGWDAVALDAEMLQMIQQLWEIIDIRQQPALYLNSLGDTTTRERYRQVLVDYFTRHQDQLDTDSQRCLAQNPLRLLDSKKPEVQALASRAPKIMDYLSDDSADRWATLCTLLDQLGVPYQVDQRLVRGLDYYNDTVFEWVIDNDNQPDDNLNSNGSSNSDNGVAADGAPHQNGGGSGNSSSSIAVCGGGRYDQLVGSINGGQDTPAIGFAIGFERLLSQLRSSGTNDARTAAGCDIYLIALQQPAMIPLLRLARRLRAISQLRAELDYTASSLKTQLGRANRAGANWAAIVGEEELTHNQYLLKNLQSGEQRLVNTTELINMVTMNSQK